MWLVFGFLKGIIALWYQLHWALYQENLNVHSWMIFCPDGIIPDSGLTGLNNIYIYNRYDNVVSEVGDLSRERPEGSLFDSYYIEV